MIAPSIHKLEGLLQKCGLFSEAQVHDILAVQRQEGLSISEIVANKGYAQEEVFLQALAEGMDIPYLRVTDLEIPSEVLRTVPTKAVFQYGVIPVALEHSFLRVATSDPFRPGLMDGLRMASGGKRIRFALCSSDDIAKATKRLYGVGGETIERLMQDDRIDISDEDDLGSTDIEATDEEASVVKFVNQIVWEAYQDRATDIHLEPMEKDLRIRYRIDGVLHQTPVPPELKRFQAAIISRIKVMANVDIAEKRLPQDGRISVRIKGEDIDIRVSTMPTVYGESVSLRLLMRNSGVAGLDSIGLSQSDQRIIEKLIHKPHGIILVTGPTGSGKSTSLYAYLGKINSVDKRILTAEDPIEYQMAGINQVQVKPEIGLNFATALRHFLRQDPDVIMVGEIRDAETAEIAIQAALTGHLVFSTLHTNDAAGGITRLVDMGIEPFLVASSIEALVAQRLIRKLCPHCKQPRDLDYEFLREIEFPEDRLSEGTIYEPSSCEECRGTGFIGRTAIYEILPMNDALRPLVINRAPSGEIKALAVQQGMNTLRQDGWDKVLQGITTIEEVLRVSEEEAIEEAPLG